MVLHQDGHALCIEAMLDFENEFRFAGEKRFVLGALSFMCVAWQGFNDMGI